MDDVFGPGGALSRALPGYEPRPEQAALAAAGRARARRRRAPRRRGGHRRRQEPRLPDPGARVGPARRSSRRRRRRSRSSCSPRTCRSRPRRSGARSTSQVLKGRAELPVPRQLQGFQPFLLPTAATARAWEAMHGWLDETATGDRAELEIEPSDALWAELAVSPDRCSGRRCPFVSACFAEVARERAARRRSRHRQPRALLRATSPSGGGVLPEHDAIVFDEAHRLEESAASWLGGRRLARGAAAARAATSSAPAASAAAPARARALDRVERTGERLLRAVAAAGGAAAPARALRAEPALVLMDALADLSAIELHGQGEELDALAAARARCRRRGRGAASSRRLERVVWAEPDAVAWAPVDVSSELRDRLWDDGPTAILVSATLTTGEDAPSSARRLGLDRAREAVVGSPVRLPRAGPDLPAAVDARSAQRRLHRARRRRDRLAARALRRPRARPHVELPGARRLPRHASAAACRTTCSCRARRRANGCSSGSGRGRLGPACDLDVLAGRRHRPASRSRCS